MKSQKCSSGRRPAIVGINDTLVEVYNGDGNTSLYYNLFKVGDDGQISTISVGRKYGTGAFPTITALPSSKTLVEIHTDSSNQNLYYSVGHLEGGKLNWSKVGVKYDTGANPAMAVAGSNVVVEVHSGPSNNYLYYRVGRLDLSTEGIKWDGSNGHKYDIGGRPLLMTTK